MKVLVTLEYEVTGDTIAAIGALHDAYRWRNGRTESISSAGFEARCVSDKAYIVADDSVAADLKMLHMICTDGSDVADVLDSCIERLEGK